MLHEGRGQGVEDEAAHCGNQVSLSRPSCALRTARMYTCLSGAWGGGEERRGSSRRRGRSTRPHRRWPWVGAGARAGEDDVSLRQRPPRHSSPRYAARAQAARPHADCRAPAQRAASGGAETECGWRVLDDVLTCITGKIVTAKLMNSEVWKKYALHCGSALMRAEQRTSPCSSRCPPQRLTPGRSAPSPTPRTTAIRLLL